LATTFLLIRHGVTAITGSVITGRLPGYSLTPQGQKQAEAICASLSSMPIHAIYSSPMERALETAAPLAAKLGLEVQISQPFIEIDYGDWTGMTVSELMKSPDWKAFSRLRSTSRPPGGESILDIQHRTSTEMERLCALHPGQTVAIFSHGDPIRAVLMHSLGMSCDLLYRIQVDPASISIVQVTDWGPMVTAINRHA
jgi:probable phosphomutase (TIGR03848 family)